MKPITKKLILYSTTILVSGVLFVTGILPEWQRRQRTQQKQELDKILKNQYGDSYKPFTLKDYVKKIEENTINKK